MSEIKFACPVCGQHITAGSESSGQPIECPTCFRKLVVPPPRAGFDSKLILSASELGKPRTSTTPWHPVGATPPSPHSRSALLATLALFLIACGLSAGWFYRLRQSALGAQARALRLSEDSRHKFRSAAEIVWTLNLPDMVYPPDVVSGNVDGTGFKSEKTFMEGGRLSFQQSRPGQSEVGVSVLLPARNVEDLAGRTIEFSTNQPPPRPVVSIRSKQAGVERPVTEFATGYALRVSFGQPTGDRLPGEVYLCLPDVNRTVVAGVFEAEIRPPKPGSSPYWKGQRPP